jgi:hypothetical protein
MLYIPAALVPKPRENLTRFHGVFSPNSKCRERVAGAGEVRPLPSSLDISKFWMISTATC